MSRWRRPGYDLPSGEVSLWLCPPRCKRPIQAVVDHYRPGLVRDGLGREYRVGREAHTTEEAALASEVRRRQRRVSFILRKKHALQLEADALLKELAPLRRRLTALTSTLDKPEKE